MGADGNSPVVAQAVCWADDKLVNPDALEAGAPTTRAAGADSWGVGPADEVKAVGLRNVALRVGTTSIPSPLGE